MLKMWMIVYVVLVRASEGRRLSGVATCFFRGSRPDMNDLVPGSDRDFVITLALFSWRSQRRGLSK